LRHLPGNKPSRPFGAISPTEVRAVEMGFSLSLSDLAGGGCYWVSERQIDSQLMRACAKHRSGGHPCLP